MKNLIKNVLMIDLVMITFLNYRNTKNKFEISFTIISNTKLKVVFNDVKKGEILTVKEKNGTILYSEKISTDGKLIKILDLSSLKNGNYIIELEKDFQIIVNHVTIKNNNVVFNKNKKEVIFKPVVRNEKNLLMVSKIAFDKEPLLLSIYYKGEIIFSETIENKEIINRAYRLKQELDGPYKVVLYNNNRSYTHNFNY